MREALQMNQMMMVMNETKQQGYFQAQQVL